MFRGAAALERGAADEAVAIWKQADLDYAADANAGGRCDALIDLSAAYRALGQFAQADAALNQAAQIVGSLHDQDRQLSVLQDVADVYTFTHREDAAEEIINRGLDAAGSASTAGAGSAGASSGAGAGAVKYQISFNNTLGNLRTVQGRYADAIDAYLHSAALAEQSQNAAGRGRALANAAIAASLAGEPEEALLYNLSASFEVFRMPEGREKTWLLLTVGQTFEPLLITRAQETFARAAESAKASGDQRSLSYALGFQGQCLRATHQLNEALQVTRQAAFIAQNIRFPQSLYRWEWQIGRILSDQSDIDGAIRAYGNAIETLQSIRNDLTLGYGNSPGGTFRQNIGPIYYELADLLLRSADKQSDPAAVQTLLLQTRQTVELLKTAQMEDYFQDQCQNVVKSRARPIEAIDPHTAIIYLVPLADRTEILISTVSGIRRSTVNVTQQRLTDEVHLFRDRLEDRTTRRFIANAQQLYDWLIRPLEPQLADQKIDTLVFVPDGALRTIPMAALYDGKDFLIAHYAIAVTPGLTLMDPRPIPHRNVLVLEAGLSQARAGFSALEFVPAELKSVQSLYGGQTLIDQTFIESRLRTELAGKNYSIVHIASHAQFGTDARSTFLLTYDQKLSLDSLEELIQPSLFRDQPVELLTLSACETAAGDDRAALGLAGVAIKAGARSAMATLWEVNDEASAMLIENFYTAMRNDPKLSKAKAMQQAQIKLLADRRYRHPCFWAPYLVIGNWL